MAGTVVSVKSKNRTRVSVVSSDGDVGLFFMTDPKVKVGAVVSPGSVLGYV